MDRDWWLTPARHSHVAQEPGKVSGGPNQNGPALLRGRWKLWWTHLGSNQGPAD